MKRDDRVLVFSSIVSSTVVIVRSHYGTPSSIHRFIDGCAPQQEEAVVLLAVSPHRLWNPHVDCTVADMIGCIAMHVASDPHAQPITTLAEREDLVTGGELGDRF